MILYYKCNAIVASKYDKDASLPLVTMNHRFMFLLLDCIRIILHFAV